MPQSFKVLDSSCTLAWQSKSEDQAGTVTNPARGQLNCEENVFFPIPIRD